MPRKKTKTPVKPKVKPVTTEPVKGIVDVVELRTINKGGRPKLQLDEGLILELAKLHCTKKEIAAVMGCHVDTLYERYSDLLVKGEDEGKVSLKRLQWKSAQAGNVVMQMWLGKQWLGQREKAPDEVPQTYINVSVNEVP